MRPRVCICTVFQCYLAQSRIQLVKGILVEPRAYHIVHAHMTFARYAICIYVIEATCKQAS